MATQRERRETTRSRLIESAFQHFAERGFEATHTEAILEAAGVSRGALYHHFESKQVLFAAVFEHVSSLTIDRALHRGVSGQTPLEALVLGCLAWLREARRPEVASILLDQGPQVLGWVRAREIENRYSLGVMKRSVQAAVDAGELHVASVELTAGVLNAALAELALATLHARGKTKAALVEQTARELVSGLALTTTNG
jgi:AcrR family transcriptional regulator